MHACVTVFEPCFASITLEMSAQLLHTEWAGQTMKIFDVMWSRSQWRSWVAGALARGDAAIFMRFPAKTYREKIWDHCAGAIIIQESGAIVSDAAGELRLLTSEDFMWHAHLVVVLEDTLALHALLLLCRMVCWGNPVDFLALGHTRPASGIVSFAAS